MNADFVDGTKINFTANGIAPHETMTVEVPISKPFRGEKLVVLSGSESFSILGGMTDGVEQMIMTPTSRWERVRRWFGFRPSYEGIPAFAFGPGIHGNGFRWTTARKHIQLRVKNVSAETASFSADLYGQERPA